MANDRTVRRERSKEYRVKEAGSVEGGGFG